VQFDCPKAPILPADRDAAFSHRVQDHSLIFSKLSALRNSVEQLAEASRRSTSQNPRAALLSPVRGALSPSKAPSKPRQKKPCKADRVTDTDDFDLKREQEVRELRAMIAALELQIRQNRHGTLANGRTLEAARAGGKKEASVLNILSASSVDNIKNIVALSSAEQIVDLLVNIRDEYNCQ
jgi:hypothetical protein